MSYTQQGMFKAYLFWMVSVCLGEMLKEHNTIFENDHFPTPQELNRSIQPIFGSGGSTFIAALP